MNTEGPLREKVALVTGGAKRIGRTLALTLAGAGAHVAITWRDSEAEAAQTIADLEALGVEAAAFRAELRDPDQIRAAVEAAALESITVEQWDAMFDINTRAPFLVAQAAYPHLKAAQGRIINIGSLG